ncbi:MAG: MAPEG family protein, partial [Myxococcales bacterium]|nr:MAPEG family protein [Myxococcales bacterium]
GHFRIIPILKRQAPPNAFPADEPHGPPAYRRVMRAHMNCVENLPLFAAVVLTTEVAHVQSNLLAPLAILYLGARVVQSSIHIASGTNRAIRARFFAFLIQLMALGAMIVAAISA